MIGLGLAAGVVAFILAIPLGYLAFLLYFFIFLPFLQMTQ